MAPTATLDAGFDLDVTLIEQQDLGGLINMTNDGCGSSCGGACVSAAG